MLIKIKNLDDLFLVLSLPKYHDKFCTNMLFKCAPILNTSNISDFLKFLKNRAVKNQDYETGAMLRDFERNDWTRGELLKAIKEEYEKISK